MISICIYLALFLIVIAFTVSIEGLNLEETEFDASFTPICRISKCFCDKTTKTVHCRRVIFGNLPRFPVWTETLKLSNNHLTLLRNGSFDGLHRLQRLYMSNCDLEIVEPASFEGLRELSVLDLSYNKFQTLQPGIFHNLHRLSVLNISGLSLDDLSIFTILTDDIKLKELVIENAEFGYWGKNQVHMHFPHIKRLVLARTPFYSFTEDSAVISDTDGMGSDDRKNLTIGIGALSDADELDLFGCDAWLTGGFLKTIRRVRLLNIGGNKVEGDIRQVLGLLADFSRLELLNASKLVESGEKSTLNEWNIFPHRLRSLDISFFGIRTISFGSLTSDANIRLLKASNNILHSLYLTNNVVRLEILNLASNQMLDFPSYEIGSEFLRLEVLDLSDNLITHVDDHSLRPYPNLRILDLSKNRIATIDLKSLSSHCCRLLEILDISDNSLQHLPRIHTPSLKTLNLSNNRLINIEKGGVISSAKRLEVLDVSDNVELVAFLGKRTANCFDESNCIQSNWISDLTSLSLLRHFSASRTGISHLPTIPFSLILSRAHDIDLAENFIVSEDWENVVSNLPSKPCVRNLNLSRNKLTRFHNTSILKTGCLEGLDLSSNQFICDCQLEMVVSILKSVKNSENFPLYNDSSYYCFYLKDGAHKRYLLRELGVLRGLKLSCPEYNSSSKKTGVEATAIGFYAVLGVLLGSAVFVVIAVCCRACIVAANHYVKSVRQRMYEPLRVIIASDLASPAGTPAAL